jgi:hypothetical protein
MAPGIRGTSDRVALSVYDRRLRLRDMDAPFPLRDAFVVGERVGEPSHRLLRFFDGWTEEVVRDTWHVFWNEELDATIDDWLEYYDLPETDRAGR